MFSLENREGMWRMYVKPRMPWKKRTFNNFCHTENKGAWNRYIRQYIHLLLPRNARRHPTKNAAEAEGWLDSEGVKYINGSSWTCGQRTKRCNWGRIILYLPVSCTFLGQRQSICLNESLVRLMVITQHRQNSQVPSAPSRAGALPQLAASCCSSQNIQASFLSPADGDAINTRGWEIPLLGTVRCQCVQEHNLASLLLVPCLPPGHSPHWAL